MKLIKRFLSGGGLTTAQGLASVFQGVNLQQGLSGDARLGNMQVKDGMFNPAPPLYAPMILTLQNNLLWLTNKLTTIPEENTALPKSNIQVALEGEKLQPNRFMDFIKRFFMGPPIEHKPYVQRPLPRNTYKIKEPLEPDVKSDMNTYSGGMLPGITVEAKDLSKPQRFPYGGINVISKPINGGLDTRQRVVVNPFESSDLMAKYGDGDKLPTALNAKERYMNGIRRSSSFKDFGDSISVRGVEGTSPWYKKSPVILEYIRHDNRGKDLNDTIYAEQPAYFPLVNEEVRAASNSKYLGKRNAVWTKLFGFVNHEESTPEGVSNYNTLQRRFNTAWKVAKHQSGGKTKLNEFKFRRGQLNLNNGYNVIYDLILQTILNGLSTYDLPPVVSGRTIYLTPNGNDTIYYKNNSEVYNHTPLGDPNLQRAKNYFYKMIKVAPAEGSENLGTKYWNSKNQQTFDARLRALKGYQTGGQVERTDNTSVASRPLLVKNKIPYGAGKGPAADSPMRLFNDPYVNMGLMAMGPIVTRSSALKDMNYTPKVPDNARAMGLGVRGLARRTGKSPLEVIKIMSEKFGNPQVYTKAFDNSEPAYGWTFENPDHYRLALLLFNLK